MKQRALLFFFFISLAALSNLSGETGIGIKAAGGISSMTGDDWNSVDNEAALLCSLGAYLNLGLSDLITIQPELLCSSYAFRAGNRSDWIEDRIIILELPVYAQFHFGELVIQGGPDFRYAAGLVTTYDSQGNTGSSSVSDVYDEPFAVGAAAGMAFHTRHIQIGIIYKRALTKMMSLYDVYPQAVNLELGYTF